MTFPNNFLSKFHSRILKLYFHFHFQFNSINFIKILFLLHFFLITLLILAILFHKNYTTTRDSLSTPGISDELHLIITSAPNLEISNFILIKEDLNLIVKSFIVNSLFLIITPPFLHFSILLLFLVKYSNTLQINSLLKHS
jgi:hypothetical protein